MARPTSTRCQAPICTHGTSARLFAPIHTQHRSACTQPLISFSQNCCLLARHEHVLMLGQTHIAAPQHSTCSADAAHVASFFLPTNDKETMTAFRSTSWCIVALALLLCWRWWLLGAAAPGCWKFPTKLRSRYLACTPAYKVLMRTL